MIGITSRHAGGRHFGAIACVCMALLLAFSFAAPFARSAEAKELKTVRIGFPSSGNNFSSGLLGVADAKGYLDEYLKPLGYKAEATGFVGAAPALHEALSSGDLDYVDYAGFAGILGKSKGIDTTLLAVTDYTSGWRLVISPKSGIKSLKDLKGKKIAYQRGATPQMYLVKVLGEAGLTFDDVVPVNASLPDGLSTLASGGVDAAVVSGGQETQLVNEGLAKVIHDGAKADPKKYFEPMVLIGRTVYLKDHKDVTVAILKALLKARADVIADPSAFIKLSAEKSGNPIEVIKAQNVADQKTLRPASLSNAMLTSMKSVQKFETDNKIIQNEVDIDGWTDSSYLKQAIEEFGSDGYGKDGSKLATAAISASAASPEDQAARKQAEVVQGFIGSLPIIVAAVIVTALVVAVRRRLRIRSDASSTNAPSGRTIKLIDTLFALILPLWVLVAWHVATSTGLLSTVVLPKISSVASTLVQQLSTGTFKGDLAISILRILEGYAVAAVAGIFFGVAMGMSDTAHKFFSLAFKAVRQIPMMAWVPLLVIWFGIGEESKVAVIFLASFFPILVNTMDGIERTDSKLVEVGRMYRLSRWKMFREIYLPSALPSIFVGLKLALGIAWMAVVGSEMIAASSGIGFRINDARTLMDYSIVFAGIIAIAVSGVLMDMVLGIIAKAATPWQQRKN
jgi:ABC-type nitrate/sulfonate/bicarbonate transport system permease component/ABC-type nitrate/sulfonate/bicarbonate transport system substrate-binding protein